MSYLHLSAVIISLIQQFIFFFVFSFSLDETLVTSSWKEINENNHDETRSSIIFIYFL
jgi:hypothetical protein